MPERALPETLLRELGKAVGPGNVATGDATMAYTVDWTNRFHGSTPAVVRPGNTEEVAAVLALCADAGYPVVPQGGNTGLVGGGIPLHGEILLSLTRMDRLGPVDLDAAQVTAEAGVTLQRVADAHPATDFGVHLASRGTATVGGAVATNAGGLRMLRHGPMRSQIRGIEAVLSDGRVVSHLAGLTKDNTGYDYAGLLAGSEGTLAVVTRVRLRLVPRITDPVVAVVGVSGLEEVHSLAVRALNEVEGLQAAEFFIREGLDVLLAHTPLGEPLTERCAAYLLLEAAGPGVLEDLGRLIGDRPVAVAETARDRAKLWLYRERHPEVAGFLGTVLKFDVSVPAAHWVGFAQTVAATVHAVDAGATVVIYGHVADGNVQVNVVPAMPADGRHQDAVFAHVVSLGGSISAEHGIGTLKSPWLPLARSPEELALFAGLRRAFDPAGVLNPNILPR